MATGGIEVFERAGRYQLYVRKLEPRGVGSLELAFRQLRERLEREGLFDPRHKRQLPTYPARIVVITSPTGAAIDDILRTIERRYPCIEVLVYPVRVQGPGAAEEVAHAIGIVNRHANALGGVDVMIVGRGGGSLEDLWAFNEETVARAIYASEIAIISAVGHEVDVSIADLVADVRAATPTAAAQMAVPVLAEVLAELDEYESRLTRTMVGGLRLADAQLSGLLQRSVLRDPLATVQRREQVVDELGTRVFAALTARLATLRASLDRLEQVVQRIAPHAYLLRLSNRLGDAERDLKLSTSRRFSAADRRLTGTEARLERTSPGRRLPRLAERVEGAKHSVEVSIVHRLATLTATVRSREELLNAMSYKSVLGRGFSITRLKRGRQVVRGTGQVTDGDRIKTETADGEFESEVLNLRQLELFD